MFFVVVQYAGRSSGGPGGDPLYSWSFAAGSVIQEAIFLVVVLAIAGFGARGRWPELLALRLPALKWRAVGLVVGGFFAIQLFEWIWIALAHPGNEQGLTPSRWEPSHATQYVANAAIVCTLVPFVEELTFRGLGFGLLRRYGKWTAILGTGFLFGLSHGLLIALPIIVVFGCVLAWIREQTDSIVPGMVLHGTFNLLALVVAVTVHG